MKKLMSHFDKYTGTMRKTAMAVLQLILCLSLGFTTSCSSYDEPDEKGRPLHGGTKMAIVSSLVNGELNGAVRSGYDRSYERKIGKSKWKEVDTSGIVGCSSGNFPTYLGFNDSECVVEFLSNVTDPIFQYNLLEKYWTAYCQKKQCKYQIFVRVPYQYNISDNTLKLGRVNYILEFENSKGFELGYYTSDAYNEHKKTSIFPYDPAWIFNDKTMLVYDNYEQMRDDVILRLKDAFGEDGNPGSTSTINPEINFDKLEKEMAEQAYLFPYWFAEKPDSMN